MANALDPMDLKQILTLYKDGLSNRRIAGTLGISRNTVNSYIKRFKGSKYGIDELLGFDNNKLEELFTFKTTLDIDRQDELMRYFEQVNKARNHPGFTFQYHYGEYRNSVDRPYGYTQFLEHYRRKYAKAKGSLKLEHDPGKEMFVDFAGQKLTIVERGTGEIIPVEVFVAILPNSHYTYIEACKSQKREDFIACCTNALHFYGGVPKAIVSDNLKSAVTRASKYEANINRSFKDFARHYDCVINPTRTYAPQDKALVENAVHLAYQRIYNPLREMTFFSLAELNREIHRLLEQYNRLLFRLGTLDFIKRKENLIVTGASGTGKSYLAQALGYEACLMEYKVRYANTSKLLNELIFSKMDGSYLKELKKLTRTDLLILDDFGLQALDKQGREIMMDIIDERHNESATIIASQIPVSAWYDLIGEGTIADAILDRIVNSSHRIKLEGESLRKGKLKTI